MQKKYQSRLCKNCTAVLSDFIYRCKNCRFAAVYQDSHGCRYYVKDTWIDGRICYAVYQQRDKKPVRFEEIPYQYRYLEAQTLLNVFAHDREWKAVEIQSLSEN